MSNYLPLARIILRYASGFAVSTGIFSEDVGLSIAENGELALLVSGAIGAVVSELGYVMAKRRGGVT